MTPPRFLERNVRLQGLLDEAHWTHQALAHTVNTLGAETNRSLHYDRSAVTHWVAGTHPQVPDLITEALSRKLGRIVTLTDAGLVPPRSGPPQHIPANISPAPGDDVVTALATLARTDADPSGHATLRHRLYRLSALDIPDWPTAQHAHATITSGRARIDRRALEMAWHMLKVFAMADHRFGSGHARPALVAYLAHDITAWLLASAPDSVRHELLGLAADLTYLAGFRCFDSHEHGLAQSYYRTALALAVHAGDPTRYAIILRGLSQQAHYLGHHHHALALITNALAAAAAGRTLPHTAAFLHTHAALCHATLGHHHTAAHHQHQAEHHLAQTIDPAPIVGSCPAAEVAYYTARILITRGNLTAARAALQTAVHTYPPHYHRSRALALALLTGLDLRSGHLTHARGTWQRLQDDYRHLNSARATAAVNNIRRRLEHPRPQPPTPRGTDSSLTQLGGVEPRPPRPSPTSDTAVKATGQDADTTSDIANPSSAENAVEQRHGPGRPSTAVPAEFTALFASYTTAISTPGGPLNAHTVRAYLSRVRQYLAWLSATPVDSNPLTTLAGRDCAVRDYRTHLLTAAKHTPSTVNAHLTAIDDLYRHLGLGPAAVKRHAIPKAAPRILTDRNQTRWLRAAQRADPRAKALAYTEYYAGVCSVEAVALNLDDVQITTRKSILIVRYGKRGRHREVPLHPHLQIALKQWCTERAQWPAAENQALFLNRRGGRLTTRGAYDELKKIAIDADLVFGRNGDLTPLALRHTAGANLIRNGGDIVEAAENLGQSIQTARR